MKATELRIGNIVYDVHEEKLYKITALDILHLYEFMDSEVFKPINLTPEWAKIFGFEDVDGGLFYDKDKLSLYFGGSTFSRKNGTTYFNDWVILEHTPKYIHQLQNLYYALTGEELETNNL